MKYLPTILALTVVSVSGFSQIEHYDLDINNANASIDINGLFFNNADSGSPGYEVPNGSDNHLLYKMSFWFAGEDINGQLKMAAQTYTENGDHFPGPIVTGSGEAPASSADYGLYPVLKSEIDNHIANLGEVGYEIPDNILNWPAHGDATEGIDYHLAPFVDVNGDGTYDPTIGDYPDIRGDEAVYLIMNDRAAIHESGADPISIEMHYMFYQFQSDDFLNNTTFVNLRLINRGTQTIYDFRTACHLDADIGFPEDDYAGFYEDKNVMFAYNGDNFDEGGGGQPGFGENPPAVGVVLLSHAPHAFAMNGALGDPITPSEKYNIMTGIWPSGAHFTEGGTGFGGDVETNFLYNGNPNEEGDWSEFGEGNAPGERRLLMSTEHTVLKPFQIMCFDYAVVYGTGGDHLENVNAVLTASDQAKAFYEDELMPYCTEGVLSIDSDDELEKSITLYPNPSTGSFQIDLEGDYNLEMYSLDGRQVYQATHLFGNQIIDPKVAAGTYIVNISQDGVSHQIKLIIQ